jgi:Tfp pilus assembly protein PilV
MTLIEICISSTLLTIGIIAVLGSLLYARRMSESSIYQNAAVTVVQGYIEQMKSMELTDLPYLTAGGSIVAGAGTTSTQVPTRLNATTTDPLLISTTTTIPALTSIGVTAAGTTGITDNIKTIDVNSTPDDPKDDLRLNLRVWIQDISNAGESATQVRSIVIQYAWLGGAGPKARLYRGSVRSIRSAVPTY